MFQRIKSYIKRCPILYKTLKEPYRFIRKEVYAPYELYLDAIALCNMYRVRKRIRKRKKDKLTVVFFMQFPQSWDKVRTVYECMKKDERFDAKIFCVPMEKEHKEFHLSSYDTNPTYDWFVKKGYVDAVNALVGKDEWYDLKELKPDYVFYTRPYNVLLPKQYRSSEVSKYALIALHMYGFSLYTHFINVVSERSFFRNVQLLFAYAYEEELVFRKLNRLDNLFGMRQCLIEHYPVIDCILNKKNEITEIWDFAKDKVKILWTPRWSTSEAVGGSNFFRYKDFILDYAKNHQEVAFLIRPHPLMFINFERTGEMTIEQRGEFFRQCAALGNVMIDQTDDYVATFWNTDILLTDFSSIIPEFFLTGKPIVYCPWENLTGPTELMQAMVNSMYSVYYTEDIDRYLQQLSAGNDSMYIGRQEVIQKYFVKDSSSCIVDYMFEEAKGKC